jgi:hypothetical protein
LFANIRAKPRAIDPSLLTADGRVNPYLTHLLAPAGGAAAAATGGRSKQTGEGGASAADSSAATGRSDNDAGVFDPRLPASVSAPNAARSARAKKALRFVEEGAIAREAEALRAAWTQEAQLAPFRLRGSRSRPLRADEGPDDAEVEAGADKGPGGFSSMGAEFSAEFAPLPPKAYLPSEPALAVDMEWWDAAFLPLPQTRAFKARQAADDQRAAAEATHALRQAAERRRRRQAQRSDEAEAAAGAAALFANEGPVPPLPPADHSSRVRFDYADCSLERQRSSAYVQHPVPILSDRDRRLQDAPPLLPLMLTQDERKRLRRQQRAERFKEQLDQVRLGLLPAPGPRVRLTNLMRVLTDSAVADPSAIEARVREQMAERARSHDARNAAKALSRDERKAKLLAKFGRHGAAGPDVALFRATALTDRRARFKVEASAKDMGLVGRVLLCRDLGCSLVYVEGGTRAVTKFVRLMRDRIDWRREAAAVRTLAKRRAAAAAARAKAEAAEAAVAADAEAEAAAAAGGNALAEGAAKDSGADAEEELEVEEEEEDEDDWDTLDEGSRAAILSGQMTRTRGGTGPHCLCELVWKGVAGQKHFADFRFELANSASACRRTMDSAGVAHLWDAVAQSAAAAAARGVGSSSGGNGAGGASGAPPNLFGDDDLLGGASFTGAAAFSAAGFAPAFSSAAAGKAGGAADDSADSDEDDDEEGGGESSDTDASDAAA